MLPLCALALSTVTASGTWAADGRECSRFPGWWNQATRRAPAAPQAAAATPAVAIAPAAAAIPAAEVVRVAASDSENEIAKVIHTRATWYGPGFHGRRTASGERFNQNAMTLASRHLPFGTRVRVVNLRNGRAAVARVNDRGPFRSGYTADLSKGLASRIGMGGHGAIRLEILKKRK